MAASAKRAKRTIQVAAVVHNRYTYLFPPKRGPAAELLDEAFRHHPPGYQWSDLYVEGVWDGYKHWMRRGRVPTGLYVELKSVIEATTPVHFLETNKAQPLVFRPIADVKYHGITPHPYQLKALSSIINGPVCGGIILKATGSGKTALAAMLAASLKGYMCFVVDELNLLDQARTEISHIIGEPVGIVGNSQFKPRRITVATIQTLRQLGRRSAIRAWLREVSKGVVILDEFHLALNDRCFRFIERVRPRTVIGLTATLELQKPHIKMAAMALAGPVLYSYPLRKGVAQGYLSHNLAVLLDYRRAKSKSPLRFVGEDPQTYADAYTQQIVRDGRRNAIIAALAKAGVKAGKRVVILLERVAHLSIMSRRLQEINHVVVSGECPLPERRRARKAMDAGRLPLIIANRVFAKGVNIRSLDLIIDGCATRGANSTMQRLGRGTRRVAGKLGLIYIDIHDCVPGNQFGSAARARARALGRAGVPVWPHKPVAPDQASQLISDATKRLRRLATRCGGQKE